MPHAQSIASERTTGTPSSPAPVSRMHLIRRLFTRDRNQRRKFYKAISYRLVGSLATVLISFFLTQEITVSLSIGAVEMIGKVVLFYAHETVWEQIP